MVVVLKEVCKVGVVLQRFTVSVIVAGLDDSSNVTRVIVLVAVTVYSGDSFNLRVDRESVMVFSTRLVLSTRVRCVDVFVRMIRVIEAVDDARRVVVLVRVTRVGETVEDARLVDDAVGGPCKETVEMVLTTVVVERK